MSVEYIGINNFASKIFDCSEPCVVSFSRVTCNMCTTLKPQIIELADSYKGKFTFFFVEDAGEDAKLGTIFNINGVPTIFIFNGTQHEEVPYPQMGYTKKYLDDYFSLWLKERS